MRARLLQLLVVVKEQSVCTWSLPLRRRRNPARWAMTELTGIARGNVIGVFALGDDAVMATETGADYRRVINSGWTPATGVMTVLTGRGG